MAPTINSQKKSSKRKRVAANCSFSTSLDDLPDTLIAEILIRMSCKSCFKCKSVSKRWLTLISQPHFIRQFICNRRKTPYLLLEDNYVDKKKRKKKEQNGDQTNLPFTVISQQCEMLLTDPVFSGFELNFLPIFRADYPQIHIAASSNDLLLCCSSYSYFGNAINKYYHVCNPLTRQWVQLPAAPSDCRCPITGFITDPFCSVNDKEGVVDLNFGYSYKVVRFIGFSPGDTSTKVEIFSSETGEWIESSVPNHPGISGLAFVQPTAVFGNCGMIHWWQHGRDNGRGKEIGKMIVYDSLQNCFHLIKKPDDVHRRGEMNNLGSCKGRIRISELIHGVPNAPNFRIWELVDYNSGKWRLVEEVYLKDMVSNDPWLAKFVKRLYLLQVFIHTDDEDLVYLLFERCMVLCNISTMTLTTMLAYPNFNHSSCFPRARVLSSLQLQCWPTPIMNSWTNHVSATSDSANF